MGPDLCSACLPGLLVLSDFFSWDDTACDLGKLAGQPEQAAAGGLVDAMREGERLARVYIEAVPHCAEKAVNDHNAAMRRLAGKLRKVLKSQRCMKCRRQFVPENRSEKFCFRCAADETSGDACRDNC